MSRKMLNNDTGICILACETLKEELNLVMKSLNCRLPVFWVDSGKHAWPEKLRVSIQEAIDGLSPSYTTALLLFGFCGNAMVGIKAAGRSLVLPKAADCIPLFIGSRRERDAYGTNIYFFTGGYINSGGSIASDTSKVFGRYGAERGLSILRKMLGHYRNFTVIDTGAFNLADVQSRVEEFARPLEIPVETIPGNLRLIAALLSGNWNADEFLVVEPGKEISFEDTLDLGKTQ
jgi:hypothetical protein